MKGVVRLVARGRVLEIPLQGNEPVDPRCAVAAAAGGVWVSFRGHVEFFEPHRIAREAGAASADPEIRAPMTGRVVSVRVQEGDAVKEGDLLVVLEAMKMEYRVAAPAAGRVARVLCREGEQAELGATLVVLERAP